ncbi:unnamed protein product [Choristocarpus tenellus]
MGNNVHRQAAGQLTPHGTRSEVRRSHKEDRERKRKLDRGEGHISNASAVRKKHEEWAAAQSRIRKKGEVTIVPWNVRTMAMNGVDEIEHENTLLLLITFIACGKI